MACNLKLNDLLELSRVYAPEYNMPELHDRVLVFDVMRDGWDSSAVLTQSGDGNEISDEGPIDGSEVLNQEEHPRETQGAEVEAGKNSEEEGASVESDTTTEQEGFSNEESKSDHTEEPCPDATSTSDDANTISESSTEYATGPENNLLRQHKIFVHSSWLAVQSKYFRSLFFSGMKESNSKEVHVKVSECEEETHLKLLEAVYKADVLNGATVDELLAVLELADKYDVKFVFKKCKYVLQTRATTLDICKTIMQVIKEKHSMVDVEDLAATLQITMGKCYSPLDAHWQTERFTTLSQPCVKYLLASNGLSTQCENTVFQALMHWMETNKVDPSSIEATSTLLDAVRFDLTTIDYLYNVIRVHAIASKMPHFQEQLLKGMTYHALPPELKQRLMAVTPVWRKPYVTEIAQYSWNIATSQFPSTSYSYTYNGPPYNVKSDVFLFCGYKGQLTFSKKNVSAPVNEYPAMITFSVLELTPNNYVPLTWTLKGSCIFKEGNITTSHQFYSTYPDFHSYVTLKSNSSRSFDIGQTFSLQIIVHPQ